MSKGGNLIFKR